MLVMKTNNTYIITDLSTCLKLYYCQQSLTPLLKVFNWLIPWCWQKLEIALKTIHKSYLDLVYNYKGRPDLKLGQFMATEAQLT